MVDSYLYEKARLAEEAAKQQAEAAARVKTVAQINAEFEEALKVVPSDEVKPVPVKKPVEAAATEKVATLKKLNASAPEVDAKKDLAPEVDVPVKLATPSVFGKPE